MIKKILKWIGILILLFVILVIAIFAIVGYNEAKYEETAVPYIEKVIPEISMWEPSVAKQHMAPSVIAEIEDTEFQKLFRWFSKLGALKGIEPPVFVNVSSGVSTAEGSHTIISYEVLSHYENGDANITIRLLEKDNEFKIYHFNLNSTALIE